MTINDKKEISKAYFYGYDISTIAEFFEIKEDEVNEILKENSDYLKELEERTND